MRENVISNLKRGTVDNDGRALFFAQEMKLLTAIVVEAIMANHYPTKGSFRLSAVRKGTGQIDQVMSCDLLDGACTITGSDVESSGSSKKLTRTAVLEVVRRAYNRTGLADMPSGIVLMDGYAPVMVLHMGDGVLLGSFAAEYGTETGNWKAEEVNVLTATAIAIKHLLYWVDQTVDDAVEQFLYSVWGGVGYRPDEMKFLVENYLDAQEELEVKQWIAWADGAMCPRRGRLLFS